MEAGDWLRPLAEGKEKMYFWSEQTNSSYHLNIDKDKEKLSSEAQQG